MLAFSKNQFETMQSVWQADQLFTQIPEILLYLKEQHSSLYEELGEDKNQENVHLRIEDAVNYGYTDIEDIKQQLDMQYQNRSILFNEQSIAALYRAQCLMPQDRNSAIAQLLLIHRYSPKAHPYMQADKLYQSGTNDALENYLGVEKQADYQKESPYRSNIHLVRHSRIYRLLRQYLPNADSWKCAKSDWKTSMLAIESTSYHRQILLLPNAESDLGFSVSEKDIPLLKIQIPDELIQEDMHLLGQLLSAWTLQLYPIQKMKQEFEKGEKDA